MEEEKGRVCVTGKRDDYKCLFSSYNMVHVDDVASAQIFLLEYPNSKGRYICSSADISIDEISLAEIEGFKIPELSSKKLLDTGFKYKHGLDDMFDGAIQCCKEKGYL
ncbi:hypothetical protein QYF36_010068 [Acer negundo]|nr:hypothetical protein QYF36_010068 [Acer negundo]